MVYHLLHQRFAKLQPTRLRLYIDTGQSAAMALRPALMPVVSGNTQQFLTMKRAENCIAVHLLQTAGKDSIGISVFFLEG